ncbi:MXAN_6640 family putative metalloprotease [Nocardioides sp.]|uniref:MXAN_6640 family putative metalloprotease n=1 Tax=Nocardioides sp. TaxID=35761 RepID=UPI003D0CFFB2
MRRTFASVLVAVAALTAPLLVTQSAGAQSAPLVDKARSAEPTAAERQADMALTEAREVLSGTAAPGRDATMALVALRKSYDDLSAAEQKSADKLMARPTRNDMLCSTHVCVHYSTGTGAGDTTTPAWAQTTLDTMESVWTYEVTTRGYTRGPAVDNGLGGTPQFDVYTEDLLGDGLYGYCQPETKQAGQDWIYSGYCVLDNDYAGYPLGALPSLQVTAAHEFFHAIQFNYDTGEDGWLMEATATWMEERYADNVNDNRSYLSYGQLAKPRTPLDTFSGLTHYGNWIFFERLSKRFGVDAVRNIWTRLDATSGARDNFSIQAVRNYLTSKHVKLPRFYADFAAGNLFPGKVYSEGASYTRTRVAKAYKFGKAKHAAVGSLGLNHLTSTSYSYTPTATLKGAWKLRLFVDGPNAVEGTAGYAQILMKNGALVRKAMPINAAGNGVVRVNFNRAKVARVSFTLANAGTQYTCWQGTNFACQGKSRNNGNTFKWSATAYR